MAAKHGIKADRCFANWMYRQLSFFTISDEIATGLEQTRFLEALRPRGLRGHPFIGRKKAIVANELTGQVSNSNFDETYIYVLRRVGLSLGEKVHRFTPKISLFVNTDNCADKRLIDDVLKPKSVSSSRTASVYSPPCNIYFISFVCFRVRNTKRVRDVRKYVRDAKRSRVIQILLSFVGRWNNLTTQRIKNG